MQVYEAPLRDMRFLIHELSRDDGYGEMPAHAEFSPELIDAVLAEAAKLAQGVLLPLNAAGDLEGCIWENGVVRTPTGFKDAYRQFREGGWCALANDPAWGGQGLPETVNKLVEEMTVAANVSFSLYPGLTHGASAAIEHHASEDLRQLYMPKLVSGIWSGTMCLTEAHCGTDLGMLRTKAVPQADGSYRITGNKIFISAGEHDLTENIVHLVLARLPDAPEGVKGISLFLVPKFLPNHDGSVGARNGVLCTGIEHKMGLKASATCQMSFDDATGWIVGEANKGLAAMFTMMNTERLAVGVQGLGIGSIAYQSAVAYAKERIQGRALSGSKRPDLAADPIIVHPDVRRMLMTMRAYTEGCRALSVWAARAVDAEKHSPDEAIRQRAADMTALMTPVLKALLTDIGHEVAQFGIQVYGGHGYIREHGVEQLARDARIAMIYEGTNGVQALDLVARKLPAAGGRYLRSYAELIIAFIGQHKDVSGMGELVGALEKAAGALQIATQVIAETGMTDPEEAGAASSDYLRLLGLVSIAYLFARSAKIAGIKLAKGEDPDGFYAAKLVTIRFFFERLLPQAGALLAAIKAGKRSMMELPEDAF